MYKVSFKLSFIRQAKSLDDESIRLLKQKIRLLQHREHHRSLKVHKLHGKFSGYYSFSLNYKMRVVFTFQHDNEVVLCYTGDHDIYK